MGLIDTSGRRINYLRLSVTDRCNLRCSYCMPEKGVPKVTHGDILRYEDLLRVAQAAVSLGIEKIRVTGGEPLVRLGISGFLARLAAIPGLRQLVLTTNGVLLEEMAEELRASGVQRLNVSLDSLRPETFGRVTRCGDVSRVWAGIEAAERAGFPLKLNMVVMRGVNDEELADFAALTLEKPYAVRFIECMPIAGRTGDPGSFRGTRSWRGSAAGSPLSPLTGMSWPARPGNSRLRGRPGPSASSPPSQVISAATVTAYG